MKELAAASGTDNQQLTRSCSEAYFHFASPDKQT
jgi:hypothetical protein